MAVKPGSQGKPRKPPVAKPTSRADAAKAQEIARLREYYKKNGHIPTLLSNESKSRFGEASSAQVSELGKLVATGKISRDEAQRRIRQGSAVTNPDSLRAGLDVSAELDPKINAIRRRRDAGRANLDSSLKADEANTEATRSKIAGIYQFLQQQMQPQMQQMAQLTQQTQAGLNANTASLQDQIKAAYQQANSATQAQVAGMGGGTTQAQSQGSQDQAFLQGIAGVQNQSAQNILGVGLQGQLGVQGATQNYAQFEGANQQATLLADLVSRMGAARSEFAQEDTELAGQSADLEESRFAKLYETKQSLAEARAQAQADADDREFERALATRKLGVDEADLEIKRAKVGIDQQRVDILSRSTAAKLTAERNKYTPGTPEYEEIQAAIDLKRAQAGAAAANARTNQQKAADSAANNNVKNQLAADRLALDTQKANAPKAGKASNYGRGAGGAQTYIKAGIRPEFRPNAERVLAYINREFGGDATAGQKRVEQIIKKYQYPPDVAAGIRRMAGIYYGKGT